MIHFFIVETKKGENSQNYEKQLARQMGAPPWPMQKISGATPAKEWLKSQTTPAIGLIFDPYFWYNSECWEGWMRALISEGTDGKINVPMGNQNSAWKESFNLPPYLTPAGIEKVSKLRYSPYRWMLRRDIGSHNFCVVVLPVFFYKNLPERVSLSELPPFWCNNPLEYRVFCEGWLHAFNAVQDAGCRHDLLSMCQWKGKVLELGCNQGLMAKTGKELNHQTEWVGLDIDRASVLSASKYADLAVQADICHLPFFFGVRFDRIVCGDVLEHLAYPWETLKDLRRFIQPEGLLLVSVPNIGHWSIIQDLISGRWDEAPSGALCITHLRFGTRNTWMRWFRQSGWEVIRWESEKVPLPSENYLSEILKIPECDYKSLETSRFRFIAKPM